MKYYADLPFLLAIAECLPGDPAVEDYGVLAAAAARHMAGAMERDFYSSDWLKAAALLETLAKHWRCVERLGFEYAWSAAVAFLTTNGYHLDGDHKTAAAFVRQVERSRYTVQDIAAYLRTWEVTD